MKRYSKNKHTNFLTIRNKKKDTNQMKNLSLMKDLSLILKGKNRIHGISLIFLVEQNDQQQFENCY
jgi:hypothetical protein